MADGDVWTGLACLKANPKVKGFRRFGKGKGAYVNANQFGSRTDFESSARRR